MVGCKGHQTQICFATYHPEPEHRAPAPTKWANRVKVTAFPAISAVLHLCDLISTLQGHHEN